MPKVFFRRNTRKALWEAKSQYILFLNMKILQVYMREDNLFPPTSYIFIVFVTKKSQQEVV